MADSEKSIMIDDEDLEDGEIEDDDDVPQAPVAPVVETKSDDSIKSDRSPSKKSAESSGGSGKKSSSKNDGKKDGSKNQDEDDFMSSIESQIANVLKKEGIPLQMPNIKKPELEVEAERKPSKSSRKRRRRKERKDKNREILKKRTKVSDSDNLYMVGGSPDHQEQSGSESDDGDSSNSSYDSEEFHRMSYEERRNKRREKYGSRNERDRERDRERNRSRERERDRKDRRDRNRDSEKEVCLRFAEFGHCPDEDCTRAHEVRQPKKMELCKFWLMECCAKREKCSYMHGDFPCKYYYLGLKCNNLDCKFMHGKPLSDNLKQILLKHLDTAPKEILGDFPRIGRDNASKMIAQTHVKLCQEFNIPLPESENKNKIPSLLDMKLKPPEDFQKNENIKKDMGRGSRWQRGENRSPTKDSPNRHSSPPQETSGPGDTLLSEMRGILSEKQIENMAAIGVKTVNHINNLTVAQLNDIGLSLATIGEIQATAINMHNGVNNQRNDKTEGGKPEEKKDDTHEDVDMRTIQNEIKSPDTIMSPNQSDAEQQDVYKKPETPATKPTIMSPPSISMDYSQYLRDSNIDDENEDEPGLRIDETYGSDYEAEEKKDSQSEDDQQGTHEESNNSIPLLPPAFDTSAFLKSTPALAKVDISSSIQQLMEKDKPALSRDPRSRDPRTSTTIKSPEIASPQKSETPRRTSIYEIESPSEDEDINLKLDKDKDMRLPPFLRENGDVDFRFPFTPMANYVPATEIDGTYGTHVFEKYEVKVVDIPKPDYGEIRRSFRQMENTQDPRLKKLYGMESEGLERKGANKISNLPLDPRKRKQQDAKEEASGPKKLSISTILQNSKHYNELSSSQKMVVNEILAELSKQLKAFHADQSPSKIFDTTFISQRPRLQQILIGLNVFVNAEGEFEEIKDLPIASNQAQVVNLPNIHQMPPSLIPNLMQQPPPMNLMMQPPPNFPIAAAVSASLRPGLLGMAPNMPPFNFDAQDAFVSLNNPAVNFGNEQQNFNRNQRQHSNSNNNNQNNFRNNSHRNNSNYNRNRR